MSSVLRSNETCVFDESEDADFNRAAGVAVLVVVVASFLVSCSVVVATVIAAKWVIRRELSESDDERNGGSVNANFISPTEAMLANDLIRQFSRQTVSVDDDTVDSDVFREDGDSLSTLYNKLTIDAEKMYGPILVR